MEHGLEGSVSKKIVGMSEESIRDHLHGTCGFLHSCGWDAKDDRENRKMVFCQRFTFADVATELRGQLWTYTHLHSGWGRTTSTPLQDIQAMRRRHLGLPATLWGLPLYIEGEQEVAVPPAMAIDLRRSAAKRMLTKGLK